MLDITMTNVEADLIRRLILWRAKQARENAAYALRNAEGSKREPWLRHVASKHRRRAERLEALAGRFES